MESPAGTVSSGIIAKLLVAPELLGSGDTASVREAMNAKKLLTTKGCYTLVIGLRRKRRINVGRLGSSCFPAGAYLYTGSAMSGLARRLSRHLSKKRKKRHWHIDHLLSCREARVQELLIYPGAAQAECRHNQRIARLPGAKAVVAGFGSSDCVSGCLSHLVYFPGRHSWYRKRDIKRERKRSKTSWRQ